MTDRQEVMLKRVLAAQVVLLARQMKAEKRSTSNFFREAIQLIRQHENEIWTILETELSWPDRHQGA